MRIISGTYRGHRLVTPRGEVTRPTSEKLRSALFNICRPFIEGCSILDLFSGSGAIGLEALSLGAASATFVEKNPIALACLKENIRHLGVQEQCTVFPKNVFQWIKRTETKPFDWIFVDPPYHDKIQGEPISQAAVDALLAYSLLAPNGHLFVETVTPVTAPLACQSHRQFGDTHLYHFHNHTL